MGVTWLLGFGASHNTVIAYLYIIVNSLQGIISIKLVPFSIKVLAYNMLT